MPAEVVPSSRFRAVYPLLGTQYIKRTRLLIAGIYDQYESPNRSTTLWSEGVYTRSTGVRRLT